MGKRALVIGIIGLLLLLAGLPGLVNRLTHGHLYAGYSTPVPWALWVVLYVYFSGISAGAFLISSMVYVFGMRQFERIGRLALFTALVCLLTALLFIGLDLGHSQRFFLLFTRPSFTSPMVWIVWLYTVYFFLLLAEIWFVMRPSFVRGGEGKGFKAGLYRFLTFGVRDLSPRAMERDRKIVRILGTIGVPLAIAFSGSVGTAFAVTVARAYWHTGLLPIMFLVSALASGGALLTTIVAFVLPNGLGEHREEVIGLGRLLVLLLFVYFLMEIAEILVSLYETVPAHFIPIHDQLFGPNWWIFWILGMGMALVGPMLILTFLGRRSALWTGIAGLLATIGFIGIRWNIVLPGFAVEELPGISKSFFEPHWTYGLYIPSAMEWGVTLFSVGVGVLILALGFGLLPLRAEEAPA
ncbi:MAG: polysulfide reductase NrfD [Chloroflexi bacterium]|nr:polysulfide reductase NrfD [Chloroflexota bacterium]